MKAVARVLELARSQQLHLVLDADALYMMSLPVYRSSLKGYDRLVLTPNVVEYQRLFPKSEDNNGETMEDASDEELAAATIVRKGAEDRIIVDQRQVMSCGEEGGLKRSGGIGDVLAGTLGTFTSWHAILLDREAVSTEDLPLSCWTACCAVKRATKRAFDDKRRAMTAPDVLHHLGQALDEMTRED
jgi:ATP-dependent NAD(P)H-hydrate dehydratase